MHCGRSSQPGLIAPAGGAPLPGGAKLRAVTAAALVFVLAAAAAVPIPSASPAPAAAQTDPCATAQGTTSLLATVNRPTVGFSPCAVKPHEWLVEAGYANQTGSAGTGVSYPQGFIRFGAAKNLELDLIGPAYLAAHGPGGAQFGLADSGIGAKFEIAHSSDGTLGVDVLYTLPNGSKAFTAGSSTQTVNLDYSIQLSPLFSFGTTIGGALTSAQSLSGQYGRFQTLLPSAVLTDQFNARTQVYAEAFAQTQIRPDGGTLSGLDGGIQYLLNSKLEVDAEAGRTITDVARAHYYGVGFGVRW